MWSRILFFIIGILIVLFLLFDYYKKCQLVNQAAKLPGPLALPIIGNAHLIVGKNSTEVYAKLMKYMEIYSSPSRFWFGNQLWIGVYDPDQIKTIVTSPYTMDKSDIYKFAAPWIGNGLVTAPESIWRVHRKLIQPSFHPSILRSFTDIFEKQSKLLVQKMSEELDGAEFDTSTYLSACTINIVMGSVMGLSQNIEEDSKLCEEFSQTVHRIFKLLLQRAVAIWLHPDVIYKCTQMSKDFHKSIEWMHFTIHQIIQKKRMELLKSDEANIEENEGKRKGFLDLLLELRDEGEILSDKDISDEVNTMIVAASDTMSITMQFILLMLAYHPDVQDKVYQELCDIYGTDNLKNTSIESEDLLKMEYMERVIKETLRLFPTAPFTLRRVKDNFKLGDYILPKGCTILLAFSKLHRDQRYWSNPLKFDPERFFPEEIEKRHPNCYMPFSSGPRNCIGNYFAMMEMKAIVAGVIRAYILKKDHVQPIENIKVNIDILAHPAEPITIRIQKRIYE